MRTKSLLLAAALLTFAAAVTANNRYIVHHYTSSDGLPHNTVRCIVQDDDGFMWFGTWCGAVSFDGTRFHSFPINATANRTSAPSKIQQIEAGNNGIMWIKTTNHRLYLYDKYTEQFRNVSNDVDRQYSVSTRIIKIEPCNDGGLLLLTENKEMLKVNANTPDSVDIELLYEPATDRRQQPRLNIIKEDNGRINWIGKDFNINSIVKGKAFEGKPDDYITRTIFTGAECSAAVVDTLTISLAMNDGRIYRIDMDRASIECLINDPALGTVYSIANYGKELYFSTNGAIWHYNSDGRVVRLVELAADEHINVSYCDYYGRMWFESSAQRLITVDPVTGSYDSFKHSSGDALHHSLIRDYGTGGLFFVTTAGDVLSYNRPTGQMECLNDLPALSTDGRENFYDVYMQHDNLWIASTVNGIYKLTRTKKQFTEVELDESVGRYAAGGVRTQFQDRKNNIWVGFRQAGVAVFDENGSVLATFDTITNAYRIMEDSNSDIWVSTKGGGLVKIHQTSRNTFEQTVLKANIDDPYSLSDNRVVWSYQDSRKRIWVATFGGGLNLLEQKGDQYRFFNKFNSMPNYPASGRYLEVRNIIEDSHGTIWVGTSDGLLCFDSNFDSPDRIEFHSLHGTVGDNDIYYSTSDSEGGIWFALFGVGLCSLHYDGNTPQFNYFDTGTADVLLSLTDDSAGNIWIQREKGISCFNRTTERFRNWGEDDGFVNMAMTGDCSHVNGKLWFGYSDGIIEIDPQKIKSSSYQYPVFITGMMVANRDIRSYTDPQLTDRSIRYTDRVRLSYKLSTFNIEFAALNFDNSNYSYEYILDGYEQQWHQNGKNRIASYTNVPSGKYRFKVRVIDESNPAMQSQRDMDITIRPAWWASWWAKLIYSLLILAICYGIFRLVSFSIKVRNDVYVGNRLNELKIRFFTNVSHELRTPLTLINGIIGELKNSKVSPSEQEQYMTLLERNTNHMLTLVNQILDLRKIQNGRMRLNISPVDLNRSVGALFEEFTVNASERNLKYSFNPSEQRAIVWVDQAKLDTVVRNIISNAFKFTSKGEIEITVTEDAVRKMWLVRVRDTGIGIAKKRQSEIFDRFNRGDSADEGFYQGTGIGLSLVKEIVALHHGRVTIDSAEGRGSLFTVEILEGKSHFDNDEGVTFVTGDLLEENRPTEPTEQSSTGNEEQNADNTLPTMLLVEDNRDLCEFMRLQFRLRFNIVTAEDGKQGWEKVCQTNPDIVVTDQMMPNMTGIELLDAIRNDFATSHIPVIILTAKSDEQTKMSAIRHKANALITKPFSKEYLLAKIEQLLSAREEFRRHLLSSDFTIQTPEQSDNAYGQHLSERDVELLAKIHTIIEDNIDNYSFNIDTIAATVGLSRSSFYKKVKSITNLAPVDFVKEIRFEQATQLIKTTDMTISEIAFAVGFNDPGYFGKCFRRRMNCTPSEYMAKNRTVNSEPNGAEGVTTNKTKL